MVKVYSIMVKNVWGGVLLAIGLVWAVMGFLIWLPADNIIENIVLAEHVRDLILYVVVPAVLFLFASIISAVRSDEY